jgi:hypothetical protein
MSILELRAIIGFVILAIFCWVGVLCVALKPKFDIAREKWAIRRMRRAMHVPLRKLNDLMLPYESTARERRL